MTLSDKFSLKGHWWLPGAPDRAVGGTLEYDPDGDNRLDLDGTFRETPTGEYRALSAPVVLGQSLDGKACTIVDVHETGFRPCAPGVTTSSFLYSKLFVGSEFVDPQGAVFESVLASLTDLPGWLHREPFEIESSSHATKTPSIVSTYKMPEEVSIPIRSLQASIRFQSRVSTSREYQKCAVRHEEFVCIRPKKKQSLEWFLEAVFRLRMLLSLLVGRPANITAIKLCTKKRKLPNLGNKLYREYLDLCLKQVGTSVSRSLFPQEIPFAYPSIRKKIRPIFEAWYDKVELLRTTYGLYFGVTANRGTPREFQFLALIQALEAFHRATGTDKYVSDESFSPTRAALVSAIPPSVEPDLREALKARLRYGNEFSLRKRLTLLLERLPAELRDVVTEANSGFVGRIVSTRNYLTHRDESQKSEVMDRAEMFNAIEALKMVIAFLLLTETGVEQEKVVDVMLNHWTYKNRPRVRTRES